MRNALKFFSVVGLLGFAACSNSPEPVATTEPAEVNDTIATSRESTASPAIDRRSSEMFEDRGTSSSGMEDGRSSHDAHIKRDRVVNPRLSGTPRTPSAPAPAPQSGSAKSPGRNTVTGP